jgi:hypothetical protein
VETLAEVIKVLRHLINAAWSGGTVAEAAAKDLHATLDAIDPAVAEAQAQAAAGLTAEEQAQLDALEAKQAAARNTEPARQPAPSFGQESNPYA